MIFVKESKGDTAHLGYSLRTRYPAPWEGCKIRQDFSFEKRRILLSL